MSLDDHPMDRTGHIWRMRGAEAWERIFLSYFWVDFEGVE